ncbi:MAG TPA: DEAD/DEAH box helicase [Chlamydiales bacterium]|nr:DEAD/DEAH box helicase [Chlamydiales bacterium]
MEIPQTLVPFIKEGKQLLEKGKVGEVLFSERTYQVEVVPAKGESFWPFLQFDANDHVRDAFCTCPVSEKEGGCEHLAAAFLRIYNGFEEPLHVRYKNSLWYQLFFMAAKRHGYEVKVVKQKHKGSYFCESKTKKKLFEITAKGASAIKKLEGIVKEKPVETEESSIKFASLSSEELALYKAGQMSLKLRFELSFWSDLAKWFMSLQDLKKPYQIKFDYSTEEIPQEIEIAFDEVKGIFYLSFASLPLLIPSLKTVHSPLAVHEEDRIDSITYDPKKQSFEIHFSTKKETTVSPFEGISMGEWSYVPHKGFYRKSSDLVLESHIPSEKISQVLFDFRKTFETKLKGTPLHTDPIKAKYTLHFDDQKNLHIQSYVFKPGDLFEEDAAYFHPWAYLPKKGFYLLDDTFMEEREKIIPEDKVGDFVTRHRVWLHSFPGFQTHFGHFESHLEYQLTDDGDLRFTSNLEIPEILDKAVDFGSWIYVEGGGFYMKHEQKGALLPGLVMKKEEISSFINNHTDELISVQNFFSTKCPLEKMGISIQLEEERIKVIPAVEYAAGYDASKVRIFGEYTYVPGEGFYHLPGLLRLPEGYHEERIIPLDQESCFINFEIDRLKPILLSLDHRLRKPVHLTLKMRKLIRERKLRKDYWIADLYYESELGQVDVGDVWQAVMDKKQFFFSNAGLISLKLPRFNWLRYLGKRRMHRRLKLLKLTTIEWIRLSIFENLELPEAKTPEAEHTKKLLSDLHSWQATRLLQITKLKATLRPYQELGLSWLWFLYCFGLSGLLCDEMGLGKTHQAMALLAAISEEDDKKAYKYLVICPTSVIYHWQELLKKFLPEIRVLTFYGIERTLEGFEQNYDLLLTSYGILRTGKDTLKDYVFELAIFDEIQIAKNYRSQTHQALRDIDANMKLGLTGTPIENRLRELKSLFDIILPQYLPPENIFRELFTNPIEKFKDPEKRALLNKLVKPFILRRKKSDVLLDLPEKIEEISYCDLSEEQHKLYNEVVNGEKNQLLTDLKDQQKAVSYTHVFSLLLKLKQICDHPSVFLGDVEHYNKHTSGKWELFMELLNEALESDQKVVIFSQFLPMLSIIERYLRHKKIGFAGIKGSTKNRQEEMRRFKEDPDCRVFVASLLAAGVGIDLSNASIVIHYDRWWNPAKENQATDRVHRLGQSRGVQVFKLVTKNTIEEHIHSLIERKKGLIEETIGKDESDQIRFLSREELIDIIQKTQINQ